MSNAPSARAAAARVIARVVPLVLASSSAGSAQLPGEGAGVHPVPLDATGIPWAQTFEKARAAADERGRLLLLLPDFGGSDERGAFGMFEGFRVAALSDLRVVRLVQRRFVPFYFKVYEGLAGFDADALAFVGREKKMYVRDEQHLTFRGGIPILVMTPRGELVEEFPSHLTADQTLDELLGVLRKNARYHRPDSAEKALEDPLARARLALDLRDVRGAKRALRKADGPEAALLAAALAREDGNWTVHRKRLDEVTDPALEDAVHLEHARRHWHAREFDAMAERLRAIPVLSDHYDEAQYRLGLALYHGGAEDDALGVWRRLVTERQQSPWVYRADWAHASLEQTPYAAGSGEPWPPKGASLLGRPYFFVTNPDLAGPAD